MSGEKIQISRNSIHFQQFILISLPFIRVLWTTNPKISPPVSVETFAGESPDVSIHDDVVISLLAIVSQTNKILHHNLHPGPRPELRCGKVFQISDQAF